MFGLGWLFPTLKTNHNVSNGSINLQSPTWTNPAPLWTFHQLMWLWAVDHFITCVLSFSCTLSPLVLRIVSLLLMCINSLTHPLACPSQLWMGLYMLQVLTASAVFFTPSCSFVHFFYFWLFLVTTVLLWGRCFLHEELFWACNAPLMLFHGRERICLLQPSSIFPPLLQRLFGICSSKNILRNLRKHQIQK